MRMKDFDISMTQYSKGDIITGTIVMISKSEVVVALGGLKEGVFPRAELDPAFKIGDASGSFNNTSAIKLLLANIIKISIVLIVKIIAAAVVNILILRPLFSATNLDIEIGIARVAIVNSNE